MMDDFDNCSKRAPWWSYLLFVALGLALTLPFLAKPEMLHDSFWINHVWLEQYSREIAQGNLLPRWLPLSNEGLGSSAFYYYPPLSFWIGSVFRLAGASLWASELLAFATGITAAGATMYHWLGPDRRWSLAGAVVFATSPYHLFDFVQRGALAESMGIAFIPLVAMGLRRIDRSGAFGLLSLAYAGLLLCHLPLALLTGAMLVAPWAIWRWRKMPAFAFGSIGGFGLAAITIVPAILLARYHDAERLWRDPRFQPDNWTLFNADFGQSVSLTIFAMIAAMALPALAIAVTERHRAAIYCLAILAAVVGLVPGLWHLPLLSQVQFPFRALPLAEFALVTALIERLRVNDWKSLLAAPWVALAALQLAPPPQPAGGAAKLAGYPDVGEYVPSGVIPGHIWTSESRALILSRLPPPQRPGLVVEPHFWFPSWSCGWEDATTHLLVRRPDCEPRIVWTPAEWIGAIVSLVTLLLFVGRALIYRRCAAKH